MRQISPPNVSQIFPNETHTFTKTLLLNAVHKYLFGNKINSFYKKKKNFLKHIKWSVLQDGINHIFFVKNSSTNFCVIKVVKK